uniref:SWIM-type domain-containing protein n=1 Tax=Lactuca sativa TaxID=4236 RepID=A0A9R1WU70_LACSA|nr:hypothetical protein LSAT_V11C900491240 [Lactuca sativa]
MLGAFLSFHNLTDLKLFLLPSFSQLVLPPSDVCTCALVEVGKLNQEWRAHSNKDVMHRLSIALEFIREYIMKRIVNILQKIKDEADEYITSFCGNRKYQVNGPWQDQCVVNVNQQTCSCKKWEITGMPCKHVVSTSWDMRRNNVAIGIP